MTRKSNTRIVVAVLLIVAIGIATVVFVGLGTTVNRIGLELVIHYTDGTSRTVYSPAFAEGQPLQTIVLESGKQVDSIQANMLVQNSLVASSFTYACAYEVKINGVIERSGTVSDVLGGGSSVHSAGLVTVSSGDILGWTGGNATWLYEMNVPVGSTLTAQTSGGQKVFAYNSQTVTLDLATQEITFPPPPPVTSITLYTEVWDTASNSWKFQGGVSVAVSGSASGTWTTGTSGYVTMNVTAGTYSFSATYGSFSNSSSVTLASGEQKSVTLYFGSGTTPPPVNYLFSDGFESGGLLTNWQMSPYGGGTVTVQAVKKHAGTYAAKFAIPPPASGSATYDGVMLSYAVAGKTDIWWRGYLNLEETSFVANSRINIMQAIQTGSVPISQVYLTNSGTGWSWGITTRNNTAFVSASGSAAPNSGWVCVEAYLHVASQGGIFTLYVNGVQNVQISNVNTATYPLGYVRFGAEIPGATTYTGNSQLNLVCYWDDCVVNTAYIGP